MPVHIHEKVQRAERIAQRIEAATGRAPSLDELAEHMEMPGHKLSALLRIAPEPSRIDESPVDELISIDAREAYWLPDPADTIEALQIKTEVDRYISSLSTKDRREERILRLRYGIGVNEALTLDEVGRRLGVTRERIRQIEVKAIRKLKHPARSEPFAHFVLGLTPKNGAIVPGDRLPESADDGADHDAPAIAAMPEPPQREAAAHPSHAPHQTEGSSGRSALDQILNQAKELGINIEDYRLTSGRVWIELLEASDNRQRRFIRKLFDYGFDFWPGKGYWI